MLSKNKGEKIMEKRYCVMDAVCNHEVYKTTSLSEAIKYVESQDVPNLYEVFDIKSMRVVY